ncbi:MAG: ASKHA domain-containing protein [Eubacteriales bacterium]
MLTYTVNLNNENLMNIINKNHLNEYKNQVYYLHESLCQIIKAKAYYTILDKDSPFFESLRRYKKGDKKVIIGVITLGKGIDHLLEINHNQPFKTHIIDILTNEMLKEALNKFKEKCLEEQTNIKGLGNTLFPGAQLPIELNTIIIEKILEINDIEVNEQYVMKPLKTISFIMEESKNNLKENVCSNCTSFNCQNREEINLKIIVDKKEINAKVRCGKNLLTTLNKLGYLISQDCGGQKRCGKCKIKVIEGYNNINKLDNSFLTDEEINKGIRLACGIILHNSMTISLINYRKINKELKIVGNTMRSISAKNILYGIAIDVGTTTIEMSLVNLNNNELIATIKEQNKQLIFGSDVLSRAQWARDNINGIKIIQDTINKQIQGLITELINEFTINQKQLTYIIISANTIISHFIMGFNTNKLIISPFEPVTKEMQIFTGEIFCLNENIKVVILPTISAFIGSDILSGMHFTRMDNSREVSLLIDLGTNGEIVMGNKNGFLSCSTAVGPAFEGTHINSGMGAMEGAISNYTNSQKYSVIGNVEPKGICGSGLIDIISYLINNKEVDENGSITDTKKEIYITNELKVTQQDIRQVQMAKSAIRSGIELLINESEFNLEDISKVFLTGGFGEYINVDNAINIGMLPRIFKEKVIPIHNTSLQGAIECVNDLDKLTSLIKLSDKTRYIELANHIDFQTIYIKNINF